MFGTQRTECGVEILGLSCDINSDYVPTLRAVLRQELEARCKALILDLTEVSSINGSAVAAFVEYYKDAAAHGGVFCLCGVEQGSKPVFDTVELGNSLPVVDNVADAIAAITRGEIRPYGTGAKNIVETINEDVKPVV